MLPSAIRIALSALLAQNARAFFRLPCSQPVVVERADPIMFPSTVSDHLHSVMGGNGFDFNMTYEDARASTCSSCKALADLSNYWTPTLWFRAQNGSFHRVEQTSGMLVYYLQRRSTSTQALVPFPAKFRMVAGDPLKRSFDPTSLEQQAVTHRCLGPDAQTQGFPKTNCSDGLRTQVFFPSCWNGIDADSDDHKSHVAYPTDVDSGSCPSTHPVRFISIFYEIVWQVDAWKGLWWSPPDGSGHPFVLSNGDATGYHGDFLNGWDQDALKDAIEQCTADSGVIEDCAQLQLRSDEEMQDCVMPPRVPETIDGWLDRLPGCNEVTAGPADAVPPSAQCGATTEMLTKDQASFLSPVHGWTAAGCARDDLGARLLNALGTYKNGAMTPAACCAYCSDKGHSYAGVEYGSECYCGDSVDNSRLNASTCTMPCEGDPTINCGGAARLAVYLHGGIHATVSTPSTAGNEESSSSASAPTHAATLESDDSCDDDDLDDEQLESYPMIARALKQWMARRE